MTFEEYYGAYYPLLKKAEAGLLELIGNYPADCSAAESTQPVMYVKSRIKSPESMIEKLKRSGLDTDCSTAIRMMHDAVGIRVICSFVDNVYQVADWLGQQAGYEVVERKDYIAYPKPNGYRSLHLILRVKSVTDEGCRYEDSKANEALTPEDPHDAAGLLVEVQLRTIAIDFWAALEHQIKYKHSISNERMIREELKRCADEIASVDMSMQTIRDAIRKG